MTKEVPLHLVDVASNGEFSEGQKDDDVSIRKPGIISIQAPIFVDLSGPITSQVAWLLMKSLGRGRNFVKTDRESVMKVLDEKRRRFDMIYEEKPQYLKDERLEKQVRVFDYCTGIGFEWENYFDIQAPEQKTPEQGITMLRNFFRLALVKLCEGLNEPLLITKMKISGAISPRDRTIPAAVMLTDCIAAASNASLEEIYASMVLLKSGVKFDE